MKWSESESRSVASDSLWPHGLYSLWNSPGYNTGVDSLSLLQQTSPPRNQTRVFCIAGGFFANWAVREAKCRKVIGKLSQVRKTQGIEHMEALCRKLRIGRWWNSSKQCVCENRSVISDSCDPMDYTVRGILQARLLEWVAIPCPRGSSQPRDQTQISHIAGRFFTSWATREAYIKI